MPAIGSVWGSGTWGVNTWGAGTWGDAVVSPANDLADGGEFWQFPYYTLGRVYTSVRGAAVGQSVEKGLTLYTTKQEDKTFGIDFTTEGAVRGGGVLSDPEVTITKHSSVSGSPTVPVVSGGPEPIPVGVVFKDSDGKKIKGGKGVRVRIDSTGATVGKYTLHCTVKVTPEDGDEDTLEGGGVLVVEA